MHTSFAKRTMYHTLAWAICGLAALFYCYEYFLRIIPSVMEADLRAAFHLNAIAYGHLAAFYYYAYTPMQLVVGMLMDRYGPRRLLLLACFACAGGAFLFSQGSFRLAELGQFLIGFGSAFAFVGVLKLASIWLPPRQFALVSGLAVSLAMIGAIQGEIILAHLIQGGGGWRHAMVVAAYMGVALGIVIFAVVRDRRRTHHDEIMQMYTHKSLMEVFKGMFGLFKNPHIWINGIVGMLMYVSLSGFAETWGTSFARETYGLTIKDATYANTMIFLGWAIGAPILAWVSDHIGRRRILLTIGAGVAAAAISVLLYVPDLPYAAILLLMFTFGAGTSPQVVVFAVGKELSPRRLAGSAIALTNMFVMMGGVIFKDVIGALLDFNWSGGFADGLRVYTAMDYRMAISVIPLCMIGALILSLFLKETYARQMDDDDQSAGPDLTHTTHAKA